MHGPADAPYREICVDVTNGKTERSGGGERNDKAENREEWGSRHRDLGTLPLTLWPGTIS